MQSRSPPARRTRSDRGVRTDAWFGATRTPGKRERTDPSVLLDRVFRETSIGAVYLADKEHLYLGDALGNDVIRERRELLLQLMEQLHDSDVRAMALPHRGPPSSWQGLPVGARSLVTHQFVRLVEETIGRARALSVDRVGPDRAATAKMTMYPYEEETRVSVRWFVALVSDRAHA